MKKKSALLTTLLVVLSMMLLLCGCSTYGSVKKAFEKEGYAESEKVVQLQETAIKAICGEDYKQICTVHGLVKGLSSAVILEFNSTKELEKKLQEDGALKYFNWKDAAEDIQKLDVVSGNCVIISLSPEALKIFKSTK